MELAVAVTDAIPVALVTADAADKAALAPTAGGENTTTTPGTGLLDASRTTTESGRVKAWLTAADCVPPAEIVIDTGEPARLVNANVAPVATPAVLTTTLYAPDKELVVAVTDAMPEAFVVADKADKVTEGPVDGTANVTTAPGTGLFPASLTCTASGIENAPPTVADWFVPPATLIEVAAPVTLDSK